MKIGTVRSELRVAFAGALVLSGAGWVVALETPSPRTVPELAPRPSAAASAAPLAELRRVGPLVVGEELALGFRITRLGLETDGVRVHLAGANARQIAIGVSVKQKPLERPPPLEFPDLNLWYVGRGEVPSEYPTLARALFTRLRGAAGSASVSEMLERWRAEGSDGG